MATKGDLAHQVPRRVHLVPIQVQVVRILRQVRIRHQVRIRVRVRVKRALVVVLVMIDTPDLYYMDQFC